MGRICNVGPRPLSLEITDPTLGCGRRKAFLFRGMALSTGSTLQICRGNDYGEAGVVLQAFLFSWTTRESQINPSPCILCPWDNFQGLKKQTSKQANLFYVYNCVCMYVCVPCGCWCLQRPEGGFRSLGTEVTVGCEQPCGCWKMNHKTLKEQPVLLTVDPLLQPQFPEIFK